MIHADQPVATMEVAADSLQLLLLGAGMFLLVRQTWRERGRPAELVLPWRATWTDLVMWLCVIIFVLGAGGMAFSQFYHIDPKQGPSQTDTLMVAGIQEGLILLAQLGIFAMRTPFSPAPVNAKAMPVHRVLAKGTLAFVTGLPLIYAATLAWSEGLVLAQHWFAPQMKTPEQTVVQLVAQQPAAGIVMLTLLFTVALAPVTEELFFRAGIYRFLKSKLPVRGALAVAALIFAGFHVNLLSFGPLLVVGWLLARAYERTGNIGVPMVFHALFNLNTIAMLVIGHRQL